jgi:hypothetical protein
MNTNAVASVIALTVLLVVGSAAALHADEVTWEVRLAQLGDQTDEWTAMGRVPGWTVTIGPGESPTVDISGDEQNGAFRGTVLVGRRWQVPSPAPRSARVSLQFQTYCAMDDPERLRSGDVKLAVLTPERWQQFATDPTAAEIWDQKPDGEGVLAIQRVHGQGEDVTQWREWESGDLRSALRNQAGREVVIAVVWSAYHFCEEWAKFRGVVIETMTDADTEREFLDSVNGEYPGLEDFAAALAAEDLDGAKAALIQHMRTRETPVAPELSPDGSARGLERAAEILDHIFRSAGCPPTQVGAQILWNEDPHDYRQWPIHLNRHSNWVTLGRVYAATDDEKYAAEFVAQLESWLAAMPVYIKSSNYIQGPFFEAGKTPLTLDAGIRMAQTWWPAYYYFKDSPEFGVDLQVRMLRSFRDHAHYLMNEDYFHVTSNWGAMEANGLFHIGVMLPEMSEAEQWRRVAQERLVAAQQEQVYPDGAQIELTPGYHGVTLGNFLGSLEVARRNDLELPGEFVAGLEKMFEYYVAVVMPDGRLPALNDSGWGSAKSMLARGAKLFPDRSDFVYLSTDRKQGEPPERTSWRLPYAGWNIMRTGWEADDKYLLFETGPFGAGHQHEDKLGLILYAGGKRVLTEGGVYSYDTSDWRKYVLSTRAHNTVMVDGLEQRRRGVRETYVVREPEDTPWHTSEEFDFAEGTYRSGYGPENEVEVEHKRQVLLVKPDYWIVVDEMLPGDDVEHSYEAMFHLDADEAIVDTETQAVTVEHEGGAFRIIPFGPDAVEVEIISGQTDPVVQGWLPTGRHNELRAIPTAVFRWRSAGQSVMAFALVPKDRDEEWCVAQVTSSLDLGPGSIAAELTLRDGQVDLFARGRGGESAGRLATDADVALARLDEAGNVIRTVQIGGSEVRVLPNAGGE